MRVLGIDPSTKSGVVFTCRDYTTATVLSNKDLRGIARVDWLLTQLGKVLLEEQPTIAVIEGYAYANQHTLATLVEIGAVFRLALYRAGIPCYICPPSVLKKYATGKGNSKKPEVALAVKSRWGFENPSDDVVDAYVLAMMGWEIASKGAQAVTGVELLT